MRVTDTVLHGVSKEYDHTMFLLLDHNNKVSLVPVEDTDPITRQECEEWAVDALVWQVLLHRILRERGDPTASYSVEVIGIACGLGLLCREYINGLERFRVDLQAYANWRKWVQRRNIWTRKKLMLLEMNLSL